MTSIATGFLRGATDSGSRFLGSFVVKGAHYLVAGSFASGVQPFKSSAATLKFQRDEQLSGTNAVEGVIGPDNFTLVFSNGSKVEGKLDYPIHPPSSVCGSGFFTKT
jgi:hypothetical protein